MLNSTLRIFINKCPRQIKLIRKMITDTFRACRSSRGRRRPERSRFRRRDGSAGGPLRVSRLEQHQHYQYILQISLLQIY